MSLLYRKMRENEKKMEKYQFATKSTRPVIDLIRKDGQNKVESDESPDGNKNEDNFGRLRGSALKNSISNTSDGVRALRSSSLKISCTSQGDGWKKLRNSSKRDNEGWKKLRQSGTTAKSSLLGVDLDLDVEAQSSDVPTARTPTNADARDEAKSSNEVENRVSFLTESKGVIASLDVELNQTIDEELAMTEDFCPNMKEDFCPDMKEDFCPDMKVDPTLSLVEALANVQTDRKRNTVSFKRVPGPVSNGVISDEKKKNSLSRRDSMMNWSFLSRFPSFTRTDVDDNNDSSALGLSKAALTKKKQLYSKASKSRQIALQGMLYVVAFYITWFFPTLQRITELAVSKNFFVLQFFDTFLLPLQGKYEIIRLSKSHPIHLDEKTLTLFFVNRRS